VGTCRGVIKRIAPDAEVIDITHGIPPQDVLQGALVLANTLPYMPTGVHVAIVDPGVGSERKPVALRGADGRLFVGPDNGLLLVAAERLADADGHRFLTDIQVGKARHQRAGIEVVHALLEQANRYHLAIHTHECSGVNAGH